MPLLDAKCCLLFNSMQFYKFFCKFRRKDACGCVRDVCLINNRIIDC